MTALRFVAPALVLTLACGGEPESTESTEASTGAEGTEAPERLSLASAIWAPFVDVEGQTSVALELVERALGRADIAFDAHILPADTAPDDHLQDPRYHGSFAVWPSDARREYLLYSEPYLHNELVLVGREGSPVDAASLADLPEGSRVGLVSGFAYGDAVEAAGLEPSRRPSIEANLRALLAEEIDYTIVDHFVVHHILEQHAEAESHLAVGETPVVERTLHFALRKDVPGAAALIARFDAVLEEMLASGDYHDALGVDWIHVDVDGDGDHEAVLAGVAAGEAPPERLFRPLGGPAPESTEYVIEGQTYGSWDEVPQRYRVPAAPEDQEVRRDVTVVSVDLF